MSIDGGDFVWCAIHWGEVAVLKAHAPRDFNWRSLHPVSKCTLLQQILEEYPICQNPRKQSDYLKMARWMIEQGADPLQRAPSDSEWGLRYVGQTKKEETKTKSFSFKDKSAVALVLEVKGEFILATRKNTCNWQPNIDSLDELLDVFNETPRSHVSSARVNAGAVELWERVLGNVELSDVSFLGRNEERVLGHLLVLQEVSPVLRAMLRSGMREGNLGEVRLPDTEAAAIRLFLEVVYLGSCSPAAPETVAAALDLAHRWQVTFAVGFFERMMVRHLDLDSFCAFIDTAVLKSLPELHAKTREFAASSREVRARFMKKDFPEHVMAVLRDLFEPRPSEPPPKKRSRQSF